MELQYDPGAACATTAGTRAQVSFCKPCSCCQPRCKSSWSDQLSGPAVRPACEPSCQASEEPRARTFVLVAPVLPGLFTKLLKSPGWLTTAVKRCTHSSLFLPASLILPGLMVKVLDPQAGETVVDWSAGYRPRRPCFLSLASWQDLQAWWLRCWAPRLAQQWRTAAQPRGARPCTPQP